MQNAPLLAPALISRVAEVPVSITMRLVIDNSYFDPKQRPLPSSFHASHDPPNFRPAHWDLVVIQNLGGDATTLDDSDVADETL